MRVCKAALLVVMMAGVAQGQTGLRHRAVGWPFTLAPCTPGVVKHAPGITDFTLSGPFIYYGDGSGTITRVSRDGGTVSSVLATVGGTQIGWITADATRVYAAVVNPEATLTADL